MVRILGRRVRRVLIDVDTQVDLICGNGYDRSGLLRQVRRLMAWARVHNIPVISTTLSRRPGTLAEESGFCSQCIEGTPGQQKIHYTQLGSSICFSAENRMDLPSQLLKRYRQVIFEKRSVDPFEQPRADRMLTGAAFDQFIVFGLGTDSAVKATVLGLRQRSKKVLVVTDAIDNTQTKSAALATRQMEAKGAKMVSTADLTGNSRLRGSPGCIERLKAVLNKT